MRPVVIGIGALLLLVVALSYFLFFSLQPAHIASLVPEDFQFGIFYRSLNDLRAAYEGPTARLDVDPAQERIGNRINLPGHNGLSFDRPVGSYWLDGDEVFVVAYLNFDAVEEAFEKERLDLNLRAPRRVASDYFSVSTSHRTARPAKDNELVLKALRYPIALVGRPENAATFRTMLFALLAFESSRKPANVRLASRAAAGLPDSVAGFVARECDDFLLGLVQPGAGKEPVQVEVEATPAAGGTLARAAPLARELNLGELVASFPHDTVILGGAALDAAGWSELGLPLELGDAAFAFGIVETKYRARRFTLLLAARPRDPEALERLRVQGAAKLMDETTAFEQLRFETVMDEKTEVLTAVVPAEPGWTGPLFHSDKKVPPPIYVSTAVEDGVWYAALGSQAEAVLRYALGCKRGATQLSLRRTAAAATHTGFFEGSHVAVALVTAEGLRAFRYPMPFFEIASIGLPPAITAVLDVDGTARAALRIGR